MKRNKTLLTVFLSTLMLGGCSTINKVADDIGVNFWSKSAKKAPCKSVLALPDKDSNQPCITKSLPAPNDDEILKLRGRYTI